MPEAATSVPSPPVQGLRCACVSATGGAKEKELHMIRTTLTICTTLAKEYKDWRLFLDFLEKGWRKCQGLMNLN